LTGPGVDVRAGAARFAVRAPDADAVWLCLFDDAAERRLPMHRDGDLWTAHAAGAGPGMRYGYRADGRWDPDAGLWFDSAKLLVDPYAIELDRRFRYDPRLSAFGTDTADLVPRAIVQPPAMAVEPPPALFRPGGLIYEVNVRGFTARHPDVPPTIRGTIAALAHPAVIAHLRRLRVAAIELMPVVAWIDERHLPPLGLANAWGYNPVAPMALDPGLAPGGVAELCDTVAALRAAGIGVLLDLVFNHTGESDRAGPVLSLRGLDARDAFASAPDGALINDTGCGNTLDFASPHVRALALASLRHFARLGVDGFRFDLAPVLARGPGFDPAAPFLAEVAADPLLSTRVMIAEPWDVGPGGYRLGQFPDGWLEWNDRYRDDVRRFWRGDGGAGVFATRICGSADLFGGATSRSVSFVAAHDGAALADVVSYVDKHNEANGEGNRDGGHEPRWNNGAEGLSDDPAIVAARALDIRALLATLFLSRGTIQVTAGDEWGRTQSGNNNAYAQAEMVELDWIARDRDLEAFVIALADVRARHPAIMSPEWPCDARWLTLDGQPMTPADWEAPDCPGFELRLGAAALRFDRRARRVFVSG